MKRVICSYFPLALFLRLPVTTCQPWSELPGGLSCFEPPSWLLPWLELLSWLLWFEVPGRLPWLELLLFELLCWLLCFEWSCSGLPCTVFPCADPEGSQPANFLSGGQFASGFSGRDSLFHVNAVQEQTYWCDQLAVSAGQAWQPPRHLLGALGARHELS